MKKESGMTLVELLVTVLLSSIMFIIVGYIIVSANDWWSTNRERVQLEDDMRYAKRRIEILFRNATADGRGSLSAAGSGVTANDVEVGDGDYIQFNGNDTIKLIKGKLIYFKSTPPEGQEVLLDNVVHANFHSMNTGAGDPGSWKDNGCFAWVDMVTRKTLPNGKVIQSSSTVIVQNMNSGL